MPWHGYDPYEKPLHEPVATNPYNVPLSSAEQSRKENKADIPKNTGFRGRHLHRKDPDDPVYPTKSIPPQLRPKTIVDWRTGGRAMLVAAMALLERRVKLRKRVEIMAWQKQGPCQSCGFGCAKENRRILCAWKVPGTQFEHWNRMHSDIRAYKGLVKTEKPQPIFNVMRKVAERNAVGSTKWEWSDQGELKLLGEIPAAAEGSFLREEDPEFLDSDDESPSDLVHQKETKMYLDNFQR